MGALGALLIFFALVLVGTLIGLEKQENARKKIEDKKKLDEEKVFRLKMTKMNFDKIVITADQDSDGMDIEGEQPKKEESETK